MKVETVALDRENLIRSMGFSVDMQRELIDVSLRCNEEEFLTNLLVCLKDYEFRCKECGCIDPEDGCENCPNYTKSDCYNCEGSKEAFEKAYEDRTLFIRSLGFPYGMSINLVTMSNGLNDKDFIDRILRYLLELEHVYGDMNTLDNNADEYGTAAYWEGKADELEHEIENLRCNSVDDYDQLVVDKAETDEHNEYLTDKFEFFIDVIKGDISLNTSFYVIVRNTIALAVCLTMGEAIDKAASMNAGEGSSAEWTHDVRKITLMEVCEDIKVTGEAKNIYKMIREKLDYSDCQIDNGEHIVAIRQKLLK
jgi:hypothetical protein